MDLEKWYNIPMAKKWYESKTILFAIFTAVSGVLLAFTNEFPELNESGAIMAFTGIINVLLRLVTTEPIQK